MGFKASVRFRFDNLQRSNFKSDIGTEHWRGVFCAQSTSTVVACQGEGVGVSNLLFYAQSTSTVVAYQGEDVGIRNLVFYAQSTSTVVTYQGEDVGVSNLVFYASQPVQL